MGGGADEAGPATDWATGQAGRGEAGPPLRRIFGTDGIRGIANEELTVELATGIGRAAATVLSRRPARSRFVLGTDTRASCDFLAAALTAGLCSAGADVESLGVVPTACVAWSTVARRATAGAVISASHNPAEDNGIKFFGSDGYKLPDVVEDEIQACYEQRSWTVADNSKAGRAVAVIDGAEGYLAHLVASCDVSLAGLTVVVDCAHGAGYQLAPRALAAAGARVEVIGAEPDGTNINDGYGSTHPETLAREVLARSADMGIALDGDADRMVAVDKEGNMIDGDQTLAIIAIDRHQRGALRGDAVVATVMANMGLARALGGRGIRVESCAVGDRYVVETLRKAHLDVGGEQSGHLVFLDLGTTGDGILTALQLACVVARTGSALGDLASVLHKYPQVLLNVRVPDKRLVMESSRVRTAVAAAEAELGANGRVVLRASGTDPAVRVMVEALTPDTARRVAEELAAIVGAAASAGVSGAEPTRPAP